jgi:hypothetical protein
MCYSSIQSIDLLSFHRALILLEEKRDTLDQIDPTKTSPVQDDNCGHEIFRNHLLNSQRSSELGTLCEHLNDRKGNFS